MRGRIIKATSTTDELKLKDLLENTEQSGDCKVWIRCFNTDGYARMGGNIKVHRLVYKLFTAEDISRYVIRHTCDNPKCINPDHLIKGTNLDNIRDRNERGRTYRVITKEKVIMVKALLTSKQFSQKEIANIVGIDPRRVSDIHNGLYNDDGTLNRR